MNQTDVRSIFKQIYLPYSPISNPPRIIHGARVTITPVSPRLTRCFFLRAPLLAHAVHGNRPNSDAIVNSEPWISSFSSKIVSTGVLGAQMNLLAAMMNLTTERQIDAKVFHGWSKAVRSNRPSPAHTPLIHSSCHRAARVDQSSSECHRCVIYPPLPYVPGSAWYVSIQYCWSKPRELTQPPASLGTIYLHPLQAVELFYKINTDDFEVDGHVFLRKLNDAHPAPGVVTIPVTSCSDNQGELELFQPAGMVKVSCSIVTSIWLCDLPLALISLYSWPHVLIYPHVASRMRRPSF